MLESIKSLKGGKAPGPDGFGLEFYNNKKMSKFILEPRTDMCIDSFKKGCLRATLTSQVISIV